jgi:hypothetical protein
MLLISGCTKKNYDVVELTQSPDKVIKARAYVLKGSIDIKLSNGSQWNEFSPLVIGQCSGVYFYWKSAKSAVVSYDQIQILHFISPKRYFSNASILLCDRNAESCPAPIGQMVALKGCDDVSM